MAVCVSNFFQKRYEVSFYIVHRYMCPQKRGLERAHSGEACARPGVGRAGADIKLRRDLGC